MLIRFDTSLRGGQRAAVNRPRDDVWVGDGIPRYSAGDLWITRSPAGLSLNCSRIEIRG